MGYRANRKQPRKTRAYGGDSVERFLELKRGRNRPRKQTINTLGAERPDEWPCNVFKRRETGRFFVYINHNFSAGPKKRNQTLEGCGDIGAMLQDSHTENLVE